MLEPDDTSRVDRFQFTYQFTHEIIECTPGALSATSELDPSTPGLLLPVARQFTFVSVTSMWQRQFRAGIPVPASAATRAVVDRAGSVGGGLRRRNFFTAVQLLTVSFSIQNPLTSVGKIVDVGLEASAIFVLTAVAGSFATFTSGD